ncbi:hypothetical protein OJ997_27730 [Solirubrobacter phytolaccae]|uniref:DUF4333 domain-containing protein n=1 Tax=Solirubrobacter phytolaccae TaxID=1404360 RepID=A0A9X3SC03_9ACTN|nr:hypothetical protein [Solirubrobacter phytolaccae]MDA0184131.1 hypothetical protein [Solirubrobacter phytolaccae]
MGVCNGCLRPIDPAFDAVTRDDREREWHTPCFTAKYSGSGPHATAFDVVLWLICWPWALARLVGRRRRWTALKANGIGVLVAFLVVGAAAGVFATIDSAAIPPDAGSLAASVSTEVVANLEAALPLGTTLAATGAHCGDIATGSARCVVNLDITDGAEHQAGAVYVTVSEYQRDGTFRWLQTGTTGPAFEQ